MKSSASHSRPIWKWLLTFVAVIVVMPLLFLVVLLYLPSCAPTWAWKSRWVELQEPAIPHLLNRLNIGMTVEELVEVMGRPTGGPPDPLRDGIYSYNVNSWYKRGIDVTISNGVVVSIFEYD